MTWKICIKELLNNFQSFRFFAIFAVSVLLFSINPFLVSTEYEEKLQEYNQDIERAKTLDKNMWISAYKRPNPLSFAAEGGGMDAPDSYSINLAFGVSPANSNLYGTNLTFPGFQTLDWVFILKMLFSLFGILLTFDTISGEKERGTLALICSNSVSRASVIMGKYLGALITAIIPAIAGMLISVIVTSIRGNTELTAENMSRLGLILIMAMGYISLFVLLGIAVSSIVHRSAVSLLLSLSVWIVMVIVVPNVAGIVAESTLDVTPEREIAKQTGRTFMSLVDWRESVKARGIRDKKKLSEELARFMERDIEERMRLTESYVGSIHDKEDLALNISRISPASTFESACAEIVDSGVLAQRRFYRSARKYYDLYESYKREKTGMADKYLAYLKGRVDIDGETVVVSPPQPKPLPRDISDFPAIPEFELSVGESIISGLWSIILLAIWNVILLMLAHVAFVRYDVRQ